jgi:hypothetical protein
MDIYSRRSLWNNLLVIIGIVILVVTIIYTNYLSTELARSEEKNKEIYLQALADIMKSENLDENLSTEVDIIEKFTLPVILESESGDLEGFNFGGEDELDKFELQLKKESFLAKGLIPVEGTGYANKIYFFDSPLYARIKFFPIIQILLITIFIVLGYYAVTTSRRAEQNRVWAGMAKETAHQLGTPISAILAWLEFLKDSNQDRPEQIEVIHELSDDVNRLELIADRFSKIGSAPELVEANIYEELSLIKSYMQRRAPKKIIFNFPDAKFHSEIKVAINKHLYSWVMENLIRNALDSMDGKGEINAQVYNEGSYVCVDLKDSGKGVPPGKHNTIFQPGYTTKKRGWGLGLSLAKRIIEEYHRGKIYVKSSRPNEGTVFTIKLPAIS